MAWEDNKKSKCFFHWAPVMGTRASGIMAVSPPGSVKHALISNKSDAYFTSKHYQLLAKTPEFTLRTLTWHWCSWENLFASGNLEKQRCKEKNVGLNTNSFRVYTWVPLSLGSIDLPSQESTLLLRATSWKSLQVSWWCWCDDKDLE